MSDSEIRQMVIDGFHKMKTQDDLLALLNKVYRNVLCSDVEESVFKPITMKSLNYYKNVKASGKRRYRTFYIRKKSGKMRTISAPCRGLKVIQYCLNIIFQAFYEPNANACGFVPGKSIADGAKAHTGKKYVYNIDLKDFFDTVELYRVKAMLTLPPFNLTDAKNNSQSLPYVIANLCCHPKQVTRLNSNGEWIEVTRPVLPQGAPTSPILTNLVCRQMDRRLDGLARRFRATYTRYADDITFSANANLFRPGSAFITEMKRIIEEDQHFVINEEKTRVQSCKYRQEVTGLIVNERVNVTKRYVKQLRMWLYLWEHYGIERASRYFVRDYMADKGNVKRATAKMENVVGGKLEYLRMVVGEDDSRYKSLRQRFDNLVNSDVMGVDVAGEPVSPRPIGRNDTKMIADLLDLLVSKM